MRITDRERAAFLLGIEYVAEHFQKIIDDDLLGHGSGRKHRVILKDFAAHALRVGAVPPSIVNEVDIDLSQLVREGAIHL